MTQCSPCYSAVSATLTNILPVVLIIRILSNGPDPLPAAPLEIITSLLQHFTAESSKQFLEEAE